MSHLLPAKDGSFPHFPPLNAPPPHDPFPPTHTLFASFLTHIQSNLFQIKIFGALVLSSNS